MESNEETRQLLIEIRDSVRHGHAEVIAEYRRLQEGYNKTQGGIRQTALVLFVVCVLLTGIIIGQSYMASYLPIDIPPNPSPPAENAPKK